MYPITKLVLVLLLVQQNAEMHKTLPLIPAIMENCIYTILKLHACITRHANVLIQSRWGLAVPYDLLLEVMLRRGPS